MGDRDALLYQSLARLTEQLQLVSMLPHEERLEAALDIMHSHLPMGLSYYS